MNGSIWATLGIEPTNDAIEIKRAYARRLKLVHPEDDPEGFQALREAYDHATRMARNGWAVPRPAGASEDEEADDAAWTPQVVSADADGWSDRQDDRWSHAQTEPRPAPVSDVPEDIRAELARERDLAEAHKALCDQLSTLVANPDGDRHAALSAMLRILRSPGMDSLDAYARTERWLAYLTAVGGPVVDDMVEPLIQFFHWNEQPVGVDLSHAVPVLRRRDAGIILRRLERKMDPDHKAWIALRDKPTRLSRLRERFAPGLDKRVLALLERIDQDLPEVAQRMNPEAAAWWRERRQRPELPARFLWILLFAPPFVGSQGVISNVFGPPSWSIFFALTTVTATALLGAGLAWLYGVVHLRLRWTHEGLAWRAPPWLRLGWAPATAAVVVLSSLLPVSLVGAAAYWLLLGPLLVWTRIVNAHLEAPYDPRGSFFAGLPLLAWLVIHAHGPQSVGLCWTAAGAVLIAHQGRPALEEAWLSLSETLRRQIATGLAGAAVLTGLAVLLTPDWSYRALPAAAVILLTLAARPIRMAQPPAAVTLWLQWMRFGWVAAYILVALVPGQVIAEASYRGFGLWLAAGALLTALCEAAPRLQALLARRARKPGALA